MLYRIRLAVTAFVLMLGATATPASAGGGPSGLSSDLSGTWQVTIDCHNRPCFPGAKSTIATGKVMLERHVDRTSGVTFFLGRPFKGERISQLPVVLIRSGRFILMHTHI